MLQTAPPIAKKNRNWLYGFLAVLGGLFVLVWLIGLLRPSLTLDIGAADRLDRLYLETGAGGFFQPEKQPLEPQEVPRDVTYRWTGRVSYIKLPWLLTAMPLKVTLQATAPRPGINPDAPGTKLTVISERGLDRAALATFDVTGRFDGQAYSFNLPAYIRPSLDTLNLRFEADSSYQPGGGDIRNLATIFFSLKVEPDIAAFGIKGWLASFARPVTLVLLCLSCWLLAWLVTRRSAISLWVESGAALLLLLSTLFWAADAEPHYLAWTFILSSACLLVWLATIFSDARSSPITVQRSLLPEDSENVILSEAKNLRTLHSVQGDNNGLPSSFVWVAMLYPIMPIAQFAFGRLNLYELNPASLTLAIYTGAILFSLAMYIAAANAPISFEQAFTRAMLVAAAVSFGYSLFYVFQNDLYRGADFKVYYNALVGYQNGNSLYNFDQLINQPGQAVRMPPVFAPVLWVLSAFFGENNQAASQVWRVINVLLLIPTAWVLVKIFGGKHNGCNYTPAVIFLILNFAQVNETIAYGQFNIIVLLVLALMGLSVKHNRIFSSGVALALPIGLKLYPIMSTFYYLLSRASVKEDFAPENTRGKRPFATLRVTRIAGSGFSGLLAGGLVLGVLSGLTVGFNNVWLYISEVVWKVNKPEMDISNQSLFGLFARLDTAQVISDYKGSFSTWVIGAGYGGALLCTALNFVIIRPVKANNWQIEQLKLGSLALLALIIPPFVWLHYSVTGLAAIMVLLVALDSTAKGTKWQLLLFAVCYSMLGYGGRNDFFFTEAVGIARLSSSYRLLAVFALWLLILGLLWRTAKHSKPFPLSS